jgi:hypothetical protein
MTYEGMFTTTCDNRSAMPSRQTRNIRSVPQNDLDLEPPQPSDGRDDGGPARSDRGKALWTDPFPGSTKPAALPRPRSKGNAEAC